MNKPLVTHYYWSDTPFDLPAYCRPTLDVKQTTDQLDAVTCQACLRKLKRHDEMPVPRTSGKEEEDAPLSRPRT